MADSRLRAKVAPELIAKIEKHFAPILPPILFIAPLGISTQVEQMISTHQTPHQVRSYLHHPLWGSLERIIGECIKSCPPICLYIDELDKEFRHAPMYWLQCQKGLFYRVMDFVRDQDMGGRLHITVSVRETVFSSVMRSEHASRYMDNTHIRKLSWDHYTITHFLKTKIRRVPDKYFLGSAGQGKTIENWLGLKEISIPARNIVEPIDQFLLRHTRMLPRDIVVLGNRICEEIVRSRNRKDGRSPEDVVRDAVRERARDFGREQLNICASELASNWMPPQAATYGYTGTYTGNDEHIKGIDGELKALIRRIGKERFSINELIEAKSDFPELWREGADPYSVLWRHGLLGYCEDQQGESTALFFSENNLGDFNLPEEKPLYLLHPCLLDLGGIQVMGKPVLPYTETT
jgi:hypothetical protein